MTIRKITPSAFTPTMGAYSHGIVLAIGDTELVFVTGQIAVDQNGQVVSDDITEQTEFVFQNISKILEEAGASLAGVVKAQIFLTDINDFKAVTPIRNKYFGESEPVSTLVEVNALVVPGCKIEVEVIAARERG